MEQAKEVQEMTDDLVERLRAKHDDTWPLKIAFGDLINEDGPEAADRIEELERHVELRDFFLVENGLWEKFAKGAEGEWMTDDLVKRLRVSSDGYYGGVHLQLTEAADRIEELEAQLKEVEGTNWSLVQTINSLGDALRERNANE